MDLATFNKFRSIVYEKSGISLNDSKVALVSARIGKRLRALKLATHEDYLDVIIKDESGEELIHLLDVISTNVTNFFREPHHFEFLKKVYQQWVNQGQKRFRIWSAASSSGEEPYTIAMTLLNSVDKPGLDSKILATDISTRMLSQCIEGTYSEEKVKNIARPMLNKYFNENRKDGILYYEVKGKLKNMTVFRRLNLSKPPFPMKGPLDVVFCRNVMIYFDNSVRTPLLREIYRLLKPGGYLMVGHAESLTGIETDFKPVAPSIYVK